MYRLDRSAFKINTSSEAENNRAYWLRKTPDERLAAAWYLIASAWNLDYNNPPRLDRSVFSMRKNS